MFVADSKAAAITALDLSDKSQGAENKELKVEGINQKIAALLGTAADQILIDDVAVNPISHNVYMAVSRGRGPTATSGLVRLR